MPLMYLYLWLSKFSSLCLNLSGLSVNVFGSRLLNILGSAALILRVRHSVCSIPTAMPRTLRAIRWRQEQTPLCAHSMLAYGITRLLPAGYVACIDWDPF